MLKTLEATLEPEGTIRFREQLHLTRPQRVLVTLLEDESASVTDEMGSVAQMLALLATPTFRNRQVGSAEELEAIVEHNRNDWSVNILEPA